MRRKIYDALVEWKNKPGRMPLILGGARQVGKSYILKEFGSRCKNRVKLTLCAGAN